MLKRKSRTIAMLLAVMLLFSLLAACRGDDSSQGTTTRATTTKAATTTTTAAQTTTPEPEKSPYLISDDPITLTMFKHNQGSVEYTSSMPAWQQIAEDTNITVEFKKVAGSWEDYNSALAIDIASGADSDLYWGGPFELNNLGEGGAFVELSEFVPEYAPTVKQYIMDDLEAFGLITSFTGKFFALPQVFDNRLMYAFLVRKDWLDKLNMPLPETIDDWLAMLRAFRDNDLNETGAQDIVPYVTREKFVALLPFAKAFDASTVFVLRDGVPEFGPTEPEFKEFLGFLNTLHTDGLLDPEWITRPSDVQMIIDLIANNKIGATFDWAGTLLNLVDTYGPEGMEMVAVKPPYVPGKTTSAIDMVRDKVGGACLAISIKNKYAVESVKFFEYIYSERGQEITNYGVEGVSFERVDGKPVISQNVITHPDGPFISLVEIGARNFPMISNADASNQLAVGEHPQMRQIKETYAKIIVPKFPNVKYKLEEIETIQMIMANLGAYTEQQWTMMILGLLPLDHFDEYVKGFDGLQAQTLIDYTRAAYERLINK